MNKAYTTELRRVFLISGLPEPLKPASSHWQIFDNYIENTDLRLRSVRSPDTKQWTFILQKRTPDAADFSRWKTAEILLSEAEHQAFEIFEGREIKRNERAATNEIRKNRYFYQDAGDLLELDVFLGDLWGLNTAQIVFDDETACRNYTAPAFAVAEITANSFFFGGNLVGKNFADVQAEYERIRAETVR